jgi:hypothetical protein
MLKPTIKCPSHCSGIFRVKLHFFSHQASVKKHKKIFCPPEIKKTHPSVPTMPDLERLIGTKVTTKASFVMNLAECSHHFGAHAKTKLLEGVVIKAVTTFYQETIGSTLEIITDFQYQKHLACSKCHLCSL